MQLYNTQLSNYGPAQGQINMYPCRQRLYKTMSANWAIKQFYLYNMVCCPTNLILCDIDFVCDKMNPVYLFPEVTLVSVCACIVCMHCIWALMLAN